MVIWMDYWILDIGIGLCVVQNVGAIIILSMMPIVEMMNFGITKIYFTKVKSYCAGRVAVFVVLVVIEVFGITGILRTKRV